MSLLKLTIPQPIKDKVLSGQIRQIRDKFNAMVDWANSQASSSLENLTKVGYSGTPDYLSTNDFERTRVGHIKIRSGTMRHGALSHLDEDDHEQYLLADGTRELTDNWDAGSFKITAETFESDVTTGTAPLTVASTTVVANLNVDQVDGCDSIDEDNMASDSDVHVPTQQSVKAYVDNAVAGASLYAFKTITGITNDVVADATDDTLTLASADAKLTIVGTAATDTITFTVDETQIDHDNLTNFAANEHIDHTSVTLTAGVCLTGGGDISANRTFDLDINGLGEDAGFKSGDFIVYYDTGDATHYKLDYDDLPSGGGGAPTDAQYVTLALDGDLSAERVLTAGTGMTFADGGANGTITISTNDWTNETANFKTTGYATLGDASYDSDILVSAEKSWTIADNDTRHCLYTIGIGEKTSAAYTSAVFGQAGTGYVGASNTQNWTHTIGIRGCQGDARTEAGSSGTITGAAGLVVYGSFDAAGADITNYYGLYCWSPVSNSKVTNAYGIYVSSHAADGTSISRAIHTAGGDHYFAGDTQFASEVGIGEAANSHSDLVLGGATHASIMLKETTTPTADAGYGKIYTKNTNAAYFQDGGGTEHLIGLDLPADGGSWSSSSGMDAHRISNRWYGSAMGNYQSTTTSSLADATMYATPFCVPTTQSFDNIGINIVTGRASTYIRLSVYYDDGSGYPGALVDESSSLDISSSGNVTDSISCSLQPGLYWLVVHADVPGSTPTVRAYNYAYQSGDGLGRTAVNDVTRPIGYYVSQAYGAGAPDPFPGGASDDETHVYAVMLQKV